MPQSNITAGLIYAWTKPISQIPKGWIPCDGQKYKDTKTPDLRKRLLTPYAQNYNITTFIMKT